MALLGTSTDNLQITFRRAKSTHRRRADHDRHYEEAVVEIWGAAKSEAGFRDSDGLGTLLVLAQTPLGLQRVAPHGSLAVIIACVGLHAALGYDRLDASGRGEPVSMAPLGRARGAGAR